MVAESTLIKSDIARRDLPSAATPVAAIASDLDRAVLGEGLEGRLVDVSELARPVPVPVKGDALALVRELAGPVGEEGIFVAADDDDVAMQCGFVAFVARRLFQIGVVGVEA